MTCQQMLAAADSTIAMSVRWLTLARIAGRANAATQAKLEQIREAVAVGEIYDQAELHRRAVEILSTAREDTI